MCLNLLIYVYIKDNVAWCHLPREEERATKSEIFQARLVFSRELIGFQLAITCWACFNVPWAFVMGDEQMMLGSQ